MSKELVFKVVPEADTKDYISNIQQSEDTTKAIFKAIKQEAEKLRQASAETAKQIGEIVPESTTKMASALTQNLNNATTTIQNAGTNAGQTAKNFEEFGRVTEAQQAAASATLETKKQEQSFKNAIETGQALGVDVEQVTNKISTGFSDSSGKIKAFIEQLKIAGIDGEKSADLIYLAWQKWLWGQ
ncbi:hypothetical protein [Acinetobacter tjernbergiae]|uniref:Uncharacterized protein n=1 Tax=Acinetobacter tjernbergiae DSM 14971 = CIP 107465 TaxID=1120928 RepID=V2V1Y6_9GAMM|nr:hypothetical protein [Acinetobacter tjernbergiae]ESK54891.1 hypothetical protein F990_02334 [Acinetobacter tjernbergiae DSM 14971 = CIP 107465]